MTTDVCENIFAVDYLIYIFFLDPHTVTKKKESCVKVELGFERFGKRKNTGLQVKLQQKD